jgi:hypothetical protein
MKKITRIIHLLLLILSMGTLNAQWTQSNGPLGSTTTCYGFGTSYSYLGTSGGGVYRTSDGGVTWENRSNGIMLPLAPSSESIFINAIAVGTTSVYAGTNYGIFRSTNDGDTWVDVTNNMINNHVNEIILSGALVYAGTQSGVEVSSDNGANWSNISSGIPGGTTIDDMTLNGTEMFAGTSVGVFYTGNNGLNWSLVGFSDTAISTIEVMGTTVLASTMFGLFRSTDNGGSWNMTGSFGNANAELTLMGTDFYYSIYGNGVSRSTDNGVTWIGVNTNLTNPWITALDNDGSNLYAGSAYTNTYYSTNNGASWIINNNGITHTDVYSLCSSGAYVLGGTLGAGVGVTSDFGVNWTSSTTGLDALSTIGCEFVTALVHHGPGFFAGTSAGIYLSTNNGVSWSPMNNGFLLPTSIFCFAQYGSKLYAGTLDGVYMTTDDGANWSPIGLTGEYIYSLATQGNSVIAGVFGGVEVTTDDGANWNYNTNGFPLFTQVSSLLVSGSQLYAGTFSSGIYKSTDNGTNWTLCSNGLPSGSVNSIIEDGTNIYAALGGNSISYGYVGVYASNDNGANWTDISYGLINQDIRALVSDGTNIYAGTHGNGVWQTGLSSIHIGIAENTDQLLNIYPNPTSEVFVIDQSKEITMYSKLTILDMKGQMIKQILLQDAITSVRIANLPIGNYVIKLEGDNKSISKIIVKN